LNLTAFNQSEEPWTPNYQYMKNWLLADHQRLDSRYINYDWYKEVIEWRTKNDINLTFYSAPSLDNIANFLNVTKFRCPYYNLPYVEVNQYNPNNDNGIYDDYYSIVYL